MELLGILLLGLWVLSVTVRAILTDGRGHTPDIRSTAPWTAGNLPSAPVRVAADLAGFGRLNHLQSTTAGGRQPAASPAAATSRRASSRSAGLVIKVK